jgi:hypothetical protein
VRQTTITTAGYNVLRLGVHCSSLLSGYGVSESVDGHADATGLHSPKGIYPEVF